jgi:signal transduction histidine kinase
MKHNGKHGPQVPAARTDDLSDILTALCARDRSPSSPVALLDGMCRLATDMLACDCTHSVLLHPDQESCVVAATYGHTNEQWASMQGLTVSRRAVADLLERLQCNTILQGPTSRLPGDVIPGLPSRFGVTWSVYVPLRWDGELVGYQHGGYLGRTPPFSAGDERAASGFASLGAAGLATIRMLGEFANASKMKDRFLANMSHELRSELNTILGYEHLLLAGEYGALTDKESEILQVIQASSISLLDLLSASLDLSRLETSAIPLDLDVTNVAELTGALQAETRELFVTSDVKVVWKIPANLPPLRTDRVKLKIVLRNLIANALKFTERGTVTIAARGRRRGVEFTVTDTGPGITPQDCSVIFEPFCQGERTGARRNGGVGLGLYLARRIVERFGGAISVESEIGQGSCFRVWLPGNPELGIAPASPNASWGTRADQSELVGLRLGVPGSRESV